MRNGEFTVRADDCPLRGAVTERYKRYVIFVYQLLQRQFGFGNFFGSGGRGWVNYRSIQYLTRAVYYGKFAARSKRGVPAQYYFADDWRLHKQLFQVFAEYGNSTFFRLFGKHIAYFRFDARRD